MTRRYGGMQEGTFRHHAGRAGRKADHTSPLRKIVRSVANEYGRPVLELECGHTVSYPRGGWGDEYTPGTRRRCIRCAAEGEAVLP